MFFNLQNLHSGNKQNSSHTLKHLVSKTREWVILTGVFEGRNEFPTLIFSICEKQELIIVQNKREFLPCNKRIRFHFEKLKGTWTQLIKCFILLEFTNIIINTDLSFPAMPTISALTFSGKCLIYLFVVVSFVFTFLLLIESKSSLL